jgi:ATP-dependent DNA helicase RecG
MKRQMELVEEHKTSLRGAMQPVYPITEKKLTQRGIYTNKVMKQGQFQNTLEIEAEFIETLPQKIYFESLKLIQTSDV